MLRFAVLFLLVTGPVVAQPSTVRPDRDVMVDGQSIVGRWTAIEVARDPGATADLQRGTLSMTLVVNPTGHVILRGTDRRESQGRPSAFSGRLAGNRLELAGLPGAARVEMFGWRLHLVDPRGRRTVFVRERERAG